METRKSDPQPTPEPRIEAPKRPRRFKVVKLEERIAPTALSSPGGAPAPSQPTGPTMKFAGVMGC